MQQCKMPHDIAAINRNVVLLTMEFVLRMHLEIEVGLWLPALRSQ